MMKTKLFQDITHFVDRETENIENQHELEVHKKSPNFKGYKIHLSSLFPSTSPTSYPI